MQLSVTLQAFPHMTEDRLAELKRNKKKLPTPQYEMSFKSVCQEIAEATSQLFSVSESFGVAALGISQLSSAVRVALSINKKRLSRMSTSTIHFTVAPDYMVFCNIRIR